MEQVKQELEEEAPLPPRVLVPQYFDNLPSAQELLSEEDIAFFDDKQAAAAFPEKNSKSNKKRKMWSIQGASAAEQISYSLPCIMCKKLYTSKVYLQRHMAVKHRLCSPVQQLACDFCGAIFADLATFEEHKQKADRQLYEYFGDVSEIQRKQKEMAMALQGHILEPLKQELDEGLGRTQNVLFDSNSLELDRGREIEVSAAAVADFAEEDVASQ